jgi:hypothetical protein
VTRRTALVLAAAFALAGTAARADDIVTDRPGFGESPSVVGRLRLQVETGLAWTRLTGEASLLDAPQALFRFGLGRSLELQAKAPDWLRARGREETASGWSDTSIGLKWHASLGANDLSLRGTIVLPTGELGFTDERADPEVALAWGRALSGPWSLGATTSARRFRAYDTDALSPSVSLGRTLGSRFSTFVEYGAIVASGRRPLHQVDHGYTWLPRPDTQIDASVGVGLSNAAPDFFVALGVSRRF